MQLPVKNEKTKKRLRGRPLARRRYSCKVQMPAKRKRVSVALKHRHKTAVNCAVKMKVKYNLSYKQLSDLVNIYSKEEAEIVMKLVRQDFQDKGYFAHRLHGCAGCDDFIWMKHEDMICPNCNNLDGR